MFGKFGYDPLASLVTEAQNPRNPKELRIRIHCFLVPFAYAKPKAVEATTQEPQIVNVTTVLERSDGTTRGESNPQTSTPSGERP